MEDQLTYQDFDLLVEPGGPDAYRARVLHSPAGESAPVQFKVPFSPLELENLILKVGRPRRSTRGPGRPEVAPLKEFGDGLYSAVFQDEVRDMLLRSLSQTRTQGTGLRLRLRLTGTPELAGLPWELLYDRRQNRFLAQSRRTPLVRYMDLPDPPRPLAVEGPLRLLVMISSPTGYSSLDAEQEWSLLTGALAAKQEEGQVVIERLPANMRALRQRLRREAFHVFHFIGHGSYKPDWGDGVLIMEDGNGHPQEVTGEELGGLLNEYDPTRLVVLNACEGARTDFSDPFSGVAQSLIQQGLPAVVAMQFEITDDAAIIFAHELYGAIADSYPLEAALADARGAIRDGGNITEWGTPVLYSRAPDGNLFHLTQPGGAPQPKRQVEEQAAHIEARLEPKILATPPPSVPEPSPAQPEPAIAPVASAFIPEPSPPWPESQDVSSSSAWSGEPSPVWPESQDVSSPSAWSGEPSPVWPESQDVSSPSAWSGEPSPAQPEPAIASLRPADVVRAYLRYVIVRRTQAQPEPEDGSVLSAWPDEPTPRRPEIAPVVPTDDCQEEGFS
jgi:CHAT domain-containing protein